MTVLREGALLLRRPSRSIMLVAVLAATAAMLSSCGGTEDRLEAETHAAEAVAVRWLKAMADSDVETACRLMDAENHRPLGHPSWSPATNCQQKWLNSDNRPLDWKPSPIAVSIWGVRDPEVLHVVVKGSRATAVVDGIGGGRPVWLRKERGRWLVDGAEYPI